MSCAASAEVLLGTDVVHVGMAAIDAPAWHSQPCHARPLDDASTRFPDRATWREPRPETLCCNPLQRCFRAVLDDHIDATRTFRVGQRVRVRNYASKRAPDAQGWELGRVTSVAPLRVRAGGSARGSAWDEVRPFEERDDGFDRGLVEQIQLLLVRELALGSESSLEPLMWRRQTVHAIENFTQRNAFHFDYGQTGAAYSATLYLGHDAEHPLVGGGTALVSTEPAEEGARAGLERLENGSIALHRGLAVEPRIGRLLLFSGGVDNYHAPLPVLQGRRQSLQVFFSCACRNPLGDAS